MATYPQEWERQMKEIRKVNEEAYKYLIKIPPRFWNISKFSFNSKCDAVVNNMAETFNSVILGPRKKPIVTMLEEIRVYLMDRWAENQRVMLFKGDILPKILKRLQKEQDGINSWVPRYLLSVISVIALLTGFN